MVCNQQTVFTYQTYSPFKHALGMDGNKLVIAAKQVVIVLAHEPGLAPSYPKQPNTYDSLFVPRATYYTGAVDIHGLEWGKERLWTVSTSFSGLCLLDGAYSFVPKWQPPFVTGPAKAGYCKHRAGCTPVEPVHSRRHVLGGAAARI